MRNRNIIISLATVFGIIMLILFLTYVRVGSGYSSYRKSAPDEGSGITISNSVCGDADLIYTGDDITNQIGIAYNGNELVRDEDYTVTFYGETVLTGAGAALIEGTGDYTGTIFIPYTISYHDEVCDNEKNSELLEYIYNWYDVFFVRLPTREEITYWVNGIYNGNVTADDIARRLAGSDEFLADEDNMEEGVTLIYMAFLQRPPDPEGLDTWTREIEVGNMDLNMVAANIVSSDELEEILEGFRNGDTDDTDSSTDTDDSAESDESGHLT